MNLTTFSTYMIFYEDHVPTNITSVPGYAYMNITDAWYQSFSVRDQSTWQLVKYLS